MNNQAVVASLLTLLGLLVTVSAGFLLKGRRYELLDCYAQHLTGERLKQYPNLYKLLSGTLKILYFPDIFPAGLDLAGLQGQINEWDSSWGVLFTKESGEKAKELREMLYDFCKMQGPLSAEDSENLKEALLGLEVALRVDLGVYAVEKLSIRPGLGKHRRKTIPHVA